MKKILLILFASVIGSAVYAQDTEEYAMVDSISLGVTGVTTTVFADEGSLFEKTLDSGVTYKGLVTNYKEYGFMTISATAVKINGESYYSGIVNTSTKGNYVRKVIIAVNNKYNISNTDPYKLSIFGSNTAYTSCDDLRSSDTRGTLITTYYLHSHESGEYEIDIDDDYQYVGFCRNGSTGYLYIDYIKIVWEAAPDYEAEYASISATIESLSTALETAYSQATSYETDYAVASTYTSIKEEISNVKSAVEEDYEDDGKIRSASYEDTFATIEAEIESMAAVAYSMYIYNEYASQISEIWGAVGDIADFIYDWYGKEIGDTYYESVAALDKEITAWRNEMIAASKDGSLTDDSIEEIESTLADFNARWIEIETPMMNDVNYIDYTAYLSDCSDTLDEVWETIETDYSDIYETLQSTYESLVAAIEAASQTIDDEHTAGTLFTNREAMEAMLTAIGEAIQKLSYDPEAAATYAVLKSAVSECESALAKTWATIESDYAVAAEDETVIAAKDAIEESIATVKDAIEESYDYDSIKTYEDYIKSEIEAINTAIADLTTTAQEAVIAAAQAAMYAELIEAAGGCETSLAEAWATIESDYPFAAEDEEMIAAKSAIEESIATVKDTIDESYANGTISDDEDDIKAAITDITTAIADLSAKASTIDGITAVSVDKATMGVYTISGQKVTAATKAGVYIINGKKTIVK